MSANGPLRRGRTRQRRGAAIVLWTLTLLAAGHVVLALGIALVRPGLRDPEFASRLVRLQERVREAPSRPLVLVLGSSRVLCAVAADASVPAAADDPLVFNMGMRGAGPVNELICLRNLLDEGIRPCAVVIEVLPRVLYPVPGETHVLDRVAANRRSWRDQDILAPRERPSLSGYLTSPWFANRFSIMSRWAPAWVPADRRQDLFQTTSQGWLPHRPEGVTPQQYAAALDHSYREHGVVLNFTKINRKTDEIYHEMFDLCRRHGIEVLGLISMPESSEFRGWYRPETRELIDRYLSELCTQQGTRYLNARVWLADSCFSDGHHQLPAAARAFTARLWLEVVQPWAAGAKR
jgi:hypothetical protein